MRNLFPIMLIATFVAFYACNRNTKADPIITDSTKATEKAEGKLVSEAVIKHNPKPQAPLSPQDSAQLFVIDNYVKKVEGERGKTYPRKDIALKLFSNKDNMFYTTEGNKIMEAVIISQITEDDRERHYFYFKDNQYEFYRHLEMMLGLEAPFVQETIVFFKDNKIFEVQQRRLDLRVGENPNKLLREKFIRPDVDKEAMEKEIFAVWDKLFDAIEENEMNQ
ncbi:MAG: hypothetical protein R2788_04540 [Saprospiraceae bacterium]